MPRACARARVYMLSAVSQCARRGPVYLVFITKPFTEAPIRIKPLSAHADHRTQPVSARVCVSAGVCVSCVCGEDSEVGVSGDYLHVHIVYRARLPVCPRPDNLTALALE